jgi:hypothetical protein
VQTQQFRDVRMASVRRKMQRGLAQGNRISKFLDRSSLR